jgi:uncharacterized protein Usg
MLLPTPCLQVPNVEVRVDILYRMPDHPRVLQEFFHSLTDTHPGLPKLQKFLEFWEKEIEGKLFRVRWTWHPLSMIQVRHARFVFPLTSSRPH